MSKKNKKQNQNMYFDLWILCESSQAITFIMETTNKKIGYGDKKTIFRGYFFSPNFIEKIENEPIHVFNKNAILVQDWLSFFQSYFYLWEVYLKKGFNLILNIKFNGSKIKQQAFWDGLSYYFFDYKNKYNKATINVEFNDFYLPKSIDSDYISDEWSEFRDSICPKIIGRLKEKTQRLISLIAFDYDFNVPDPVKKNIKNMKEVN